MIEKPEVCFNQAGWRLLLKACSEVGAYEAKVGFYKAKLRVFEPVLFNQLTYDF